MSRRPEDYLGIWIASMPSNPMLIATARFLLSEYRSYRTTFTGSPRTQAAAALYLGQEFCDLGHLPLRPPVLNSGRLTRRTLAVAFGLEPYLPPTGGYTQRDIAEVFDISAVALRNSSKDMRLKIPRLIERCENFVEAHRH